MSATKTEQVYTIDKVDVSVSGKTARMLVDDLDTTLATLEEAGWRNLYLSMSHPEYEYSDTLVFEGQRPETESERVARLKREAKVKEVRKKVKATKREKELKELARLKAKYEDA